MLRSNAINRPFAGRFLVLAALIAGLVSTGSASAATGPLRPLNQWAAATTRSFDAGRTGPRAVERRIAALRRTVRAAAPKLRRASATTRNVELARSRAVLDRRLARVQQRLSTRTARFFFLAYQAELERLAERAGLDRTPTGRPLTDAGADGDADEDGVIDQADRDSDGDGIASGRDRSDLGWGIPDNFAARPARLGGFCVFATEAIPDRRTVRRASAWSARAARRGCQVPKVSARPVARTTKRTPTKKPKFSTLAKVGFSAKDARLDGAVLTLAASSRRPVKAVFELLVAKRSVMKSTAETIFKGRQRLQVTFASAVIVKAGRLRVTVRRNGKRGRGTLPLTVVAREDSDTTPVLGNASPLPQPQAPLQPQPAAPELSGPLPPLVFPPARCNTELDTDEDTIPDCQEIEGFAFAQWVPSLNCRDVAGAVQCGDEKTRTVTSDPKKANTDDDTITTDAGVTYGLTDAEEWFLFRSGGKSDPSSADSDADGIPDVEERKRWNTEANNPDSDGDGVEFSGGTPIGVRAELYDRAEIDGGTFPGSRARTSPTSPDTDGDAASDTTEVLGGRTNPLVAVIPEYRLTPEAGTTFSVQIGTTAGSTYGLSNTKTDETSKEESNSTVDTQSQSHTAGVSVEAEASTGAAGKMGVKVTATYSYNNSKSHESSLTASRSDRTEAQQTYEDVLSETTDPTGSINVSFRLANARDDRDVTVKNLAVDAYFLCGRSQAGSSCGVEGKRAFLAHLVPVGQDGYTLAANESRVIPFAATGVPSHLLKALAANPSNLSFSATGGDLFASSSGANLLDSVGRSIPQNTGRLSIDDGLGKVKDYSVAVAVDRDWGKPDASLAPPTSLLDTLRAARVTATTRDNEAGKLLARVATNDTQGAEIDRSSVSSATIVAGSWAILADLKTAVDDVGYADQVRIGVGDTVLLGYVKDSDNDGLLDRQERLLGTSDDATDSDGDGATLTCASACPRGAANGSAYPSDYFEAVVGWKAGPTRREDNSESKAAYEVRSDPTTCDGDGDGSFDGSYAATATCTDGLAAPTQHEGAGELGNKTDPVDPDTDGDGLDDSEDPVPLQGSAAEAVESVTFPAGKLCTPSAAEPTKCTAPGEGSTIQSPDFRLCGPSADDVGQCTASTGLYKIRWDIDTATTRVSDGKEIQGRFEVLEGTRVLLRVDVDRDEQARRPTGVSEAEELFFATSKPSTTLAVRYTNTSQQGGAAGTTSATSTGDLVVSEVQPPSFLDQRTNRNFAGISIPGSMLNGRTSTRHLDGDENGELQLPAGITTGPALDVGSGATYGVSIPGGQIGWRARFFLRDAGEDQSSVTATVGLTGSRTAGDTAFGDELPVTENYPGDEPVEKLSYFQAKDPRVPLVQGHVRTADLQNVIAPRAVGVTELFETGTNPTYNVSAAINRTGPEGLRLLNVVLEPIGDSVDEYIGTESEAGAAQNAPDIAWLAAGFTPANGFASSSPFDTGGVFGQPEGEGLVDEFNAADGSLRIQSLNQGDFTTKSFRTVRFPMINASFHRWSVLSERLYEGDCTRNDGDQSPYDPDDDTAFFPLRYHELNGYVALDQRAWLGFLDRRLYPGNLDLRPFLSFVPAPGGLPTTGIKILSVQGDNNCGAAVIRINRVLLESSPQTAFSPDD